MAGPSRSPNNSRTVAITVGIFVALIFANAIGVLRPLSSLVGIVLEPISSVLDFGGQSSRDKETAALREQVGQLQAEVAKRQESELENEALRKQLNFAQSDNYNLVGADIISQDPTNYQQFLTISRGTSAGINKGMAVVSAGLLVGKIIETTPTTAKVYLITDYASTVPALTQQTRATGVVEGQRGFGLSLSMVPQTEQLQSGDTVITSGFGGEYPKGLVIGTVGEVHRRDVDVFQSATLRPALDFRKLESVFVITGQR